MALSVFALIRGKQSGRVAGMVIGIVFAANAALASPQADCPDSGALFLYAPWTQPMIAESNLTLRAFLENHPQLRAVLKRLGQQLMLRDAEPVRGWPWIAPLAGSAQGS